MADEVGSMELDPKRILRTNSLVEPCVRNPFTHKFKLKFRDKLKIGFNAVFLMPIRLTCILILFIIVLIISIIVTLGISTEKLNNQPFSGWRNYLRKSIIYLTYAIYFCAGFHRIKVKGRRATKAEARVFVLAPHSSFFDAFAFVAIGMPCGVSRVENAQIPLIGSIIKCLQPILVTRENSKKKEAVIMEIKKRASRSSPWPQLFVFPEGTCTNRKCLISFKPGAFIPGLPVQPVAIKYNNKFDCITWTWEGLSAYRAFFYTLCQFHNNMEVTFLPVVKPSYKERQDPKLFSENVRQVMASYLKIPVTSHTYEDCRLMLLARKMSLPFDSGLVEFAKIKEKLGINYENCQDILEKYAGIAHNSNGKLTFDDFCKYLELPPSRAVAHVFNLYDRNKNGFVDFREFLIGLSLLSQPANNEDTIKYAFKLFDKENKSFISLSDLQLILFSAFNMDPNEVNNLFDKIDSNKDGLVTYDEFEVYAKKKPEYAKLFITYHELKILQNNVELERLSQSAKANNVQLERTDECDNENENENEKPETNQDTELDQKTK